MRTTIGRAALAALVVLTAAVGLVARPAQPVTPARIVSTSPSITETLFALGLGDRVVGVSQYCRFPPEVLKLPKVGTFLKPSPELIAGLNPDLVIVHPVAGDVTRQLQALHLRAVVVDEGGMAGVFESIRQIAGATGVGPRGDALVADLRAQLDGVRHRASGQPPRRVLFLVGRRPGTLADLVAVGPGAYLNELIEIGGGRNMLATDRMPEYPHISMETVLRLDPDVIIDTVDMGDTRDERAAREVTNGRLWQAFGQLSAVKHQHVYAATTDALVVPGPRIVEAAEWIATLIRGERPR
jgi:iron complex transport system substrate-binding protein